MEKRTIVLTLLGLSAVALLCAAQLAQQHNEGIQQNSLMQSSPRDQHLQQLYDIPNFVYQRTQMHFPQAEENWLNQAAQGKIGDDVKPEPILNKLNDIIADARTHALTENYEARVNAKQRALDDNYDTYDVQKGRVIHKIYGKQVGGSMTLKQMPSAPPRLRAVPASLRSRRGPSTLESTMIQQLSQLSNSNSHTNFKAAATKPYAVKVPAGLHAGQQFIAEIPNVGKMLVVVPPKVNGGELVSIQVPVGSKSFADPIEGKPSSAISSASQRELHKALNTRKQPVPRTSASSRAGPGMHDDETSDEPTFAASEHPNAAKMLDNALKDHYVTSRLTRRGRIGAPVSDKEFVNPGSEHPVAAGMLDQALTNHYRSTPHDVFGLEH